MGLLTSVNNLNYTLQEKEKERKRKELERVKKESERRHKEEEKENINYIKSKISNFLRIEFQKELYMNSTNVYEFYNINKKEFLFYKFYNNLAMKENIKIDYEPFILDFFNSNYYKILKQVEAEAKKNEEYKIYKHIITSKEESKINYDTSSINNTNNINYKQIKKENQQRILKVIYYTFAGIIFLPLGFILLILYFTCKKQK